MHLHFGLDQKHTFEHSLLVTLCLALTVPLFMLQSALGECSFRCNCSWQLDFKGTSNILQLLLKCAAVRSAPQHEHSC